MNEYKKSLTESSSAKLLVFVGTAVLFMVAITFLYLNDIKILPIFLVSITGLITTFLYCNRDVNEEIRELKTDRKKPVRRNSSYRRLSFEDKQKCHRFWNRVAYFAQLTKDKSIHKTSDDFQRLFDDIFPSKRHPYN